MVADFLSLMGLGIAAFAATNIDDIFVLMMFFSALSIPPRHVVLGQCLGIASSCVLQSPKSNSK
ncbi:MAG: hypothetical protein M3299_10230 [Thermoproteota archaeon]|nr:hypothetical protein [Thermoproteota archaeon]